MFSRGNNITINVKLFGGLDADLGISAYDPDTGMDLDVPNRARLGKILRQIGLNSIGSVLFFINGNPVDSREKLNEGDVVFCMRPGAGG
jgi:hypothetical protein